MTECQIDMESQSACTAAAVAEATDEAAVALRALQTLQALLAGGVSPGPAFAQVVDRIARLMGADDCCLVLRDRSAHLALIGLRDPATAASFAAKRMLAQSRARIRSLLAGQAIDPPLQESLGGSRALYLPVAVGGALAGVLYVRRNGSEQPPFAESAVTRGQLAARMIGQALHVERLDGLLQSTYARVGLLKDGARAEPPPPAVLAHPCDMAQRLARGFYRELRRARFGDRQIIGAATEVIEQLRQDLQNRRRQRGTLSSIESTT